MAARRTTILCLLRRNQSCRVDAIRFGVETLFGKELKIESVDYRRFCFGDETAAENGVCRSRAEPAVTNVASQEIIPRRMRSKMRRNAIKGQRMTARPPKKKKRKKVLPGRSPTLTRVLAMLGRETENGLRVFPKPPPFGPRADAVNITTRRS